MDVEAEFTRMERRLKMRLDADVKAAEQRIARLTPTEWKEVHDGLREHPRAAAMRQMTEAFVQVGKKWREVAEAAGAAIQGISRVLAGKEKNE